jgi:ATP-dependent Zn protease
MHRACKIVALNAPPLPPQISSYPEYRIEYSKPAPSRKLFYIAPSLHTSKDWDYSKFIENVSNNDIESVHITQDQHFIKILFKNSVEKELLLPEGYDIINFLINNNVDIHIDPVRKLPIELSVLDISLIILQCVFLSYVIKTILTNRKNAQDENKKTIPEPLDPNIELSAYRESGKLISRLFSNSIDSIESVSIDNVTSPLNIIPEGLERTNLESRLKIILGGRVAEEIIFGALRSSSGKSSDIEIAIQLAYDIIATYGFSQSMGVTEWDNWNTPQIQEMIQNTAKDIIKNTHKNMRKLIIKNKKLLNSIAEELIEKRTLYKDDIRMIIIRVYKKTRKFNSQLIKHLNITDVEFIHKNGGDK